jgi:RNA polymerase sigma-70 factor, ECF subfamily
VSAAEQMGWADLPDNELVRRIRRGERGAEFELFHRYRPRLYELARRILHNEQDAEEVALAAFWGAIRARRYDESRPFDRWILRIAGNAVRDRLRQNKKQPAFANAEVIESSPGKLIGPVDCAQRAEAVRKLAECQQNLNPEERVVVGLWSAGSSLNDIALLLTTAKSTIQDRFKEARRRLRECLEGKGVIAVD